MHHWGLQSLVLAIMGALFAVIGLGTFVFIGLESRLIGRLRGRGVSTTGTVIDHVPRADALDRPVIQFADRQGRQFEFTPARALLTRFVPVGERFPVVYLPDLPHKARVGTETNRRTLLPILVCCLIFFFVGVLVLARVMLPQVFTGPAGGTTRLRLNGFARPLFLLFVCVVPGLGLLAFCGWKFRRLCTLRRRGFGATGTVTRTISTGDGWTLSLGPVSYGRGGRQSVIDFFDSQNRRIQFSSDRGPRSIGATVPVVYLPDRPHHAAVSPVLRNATSLLFPAMFGLLFLSIGVLALLLGWAPAP